MEALRPIPATTQDGNSNGSSKTNGLGSPASTRPALDDTRTRSSPTSPLALKVGSSPQGHAFVFPEIPQHSPGDTATSSPNGTPSVRFRPRSPPSAGLTDRRRAKKRTEHDTPPLSLNDLMQKDTIYEAGLDDSSAHGALLDGIPDNGNAGAKRTESVVEAPHNSLNRSMTWDEREGQTRMHSRQASFFNKLKALASTPGSSNQGRSPGNATGSGFATPLDTRSPQSERSEPNYAVETSEAADADAEEESDDNVTPSQTRTRRKHKSKRPSMPDAENGPTTPRQSRFASFIRDNPLSGSVRPSLPLRRHTATDLSDHAHMGVSEDEGKDRLRNAWRRGLENARGIGYSGRKTQEEGGDGAEVSKRPSNLRRLTGSRAFEVGSSPFRMRADRQSSSSAQKWKQVKAGLKMLGQKKRDERIRIDHQKSAQLMAELLAGGPAALIFASMYQRDEHGNRKVPVLLEQLKIRIPHSEVRKDKSGDRHQIFQIDLEYGNGPARLQWTIRRSLQDFAALHAKYKAQSTADRLRHFRGDDKTKPRRPRFPKSAFPYARSARGLFADLDDEDEEQEGLEPPAEVAEEAETNPAERPKGHKRAKSSFANPRRTSTGELATANPETLSTRQREVYTERQRRKLETYLQQMIRWLIFRADSTRLCKFLEVSAMAVRLSAEGGFQGKQGLLTIASRSNRDIRKFNANAFKERHKPRWFLIRHSYVVCVDGPDSLIPYDVFLVDSDFTIGKRGKKIGEQQAAGEESQGLVEVANSRRKHHFVRLYNAERKLKLIARNERQYLQFQESLNQMMENTIWARKQRFDSFAPVRNNVWTRWLIDGRDHMWQVSRAIDNAKDFIYIHDWWLSPELYLRRPAAISQKWRLDRLLQRKAQEGVKIFVIVYRNIESAIPINSEYTKWALLDLHENICVQRSPNQFRQNQFFWAHHEKLVVIDNMMAFVGGVDLCFGRWDDACHTLTDDKLTGFELDSNTPRDCEHCQVWPGKDYSNPRVLDFYALNRPYEEMYDRTKTPRMPWHDISMQIVGQPARDIGRHFVQRWNFVLRSRVPSRPTPVLMPPPEYEHAELERLGMTGTCQVQILRSCSPWSIGTPNKVEHSIMTAYCHLIKHSEHFVYIENQFFISSCDVQGTTIHNTIGDAIVERAIRAYEDGEAWRAVLIIPLMPGFQNSVEDQDGTSVRLIMQCQFRSICRGETSIFARLRSKGIDPEQYVRFYSLRQWGKIGPRKCLTTEQLYIHAKCMIVDDRSVIIGSANINERSMVGHRDSEVAAIVTDTKMIPSYMAGKPYEVGEFAHTMRKRLMREHLGIDVDAIFRREQAEREREEQDREMSRIYRTDDDDGADASGFETPPETPSLPNGFRKEPISHDMTTANETDEIAWSGTTRAGTAYDADTVPDASGADLVGNETERNHDLDVDGYGFDNMKAIHSEGDVGLTDSYIDPSGHEILLRKDAPASRRIREEAQKRQQRTQHERQSGIPAQPPWPTGRTDTYLLGLMPRSRLPELPSVDDTDIGGPSLQTTTNLTPSLTLRRPEITEDCMRDPLDDAFFYRVWNQVADNNTKIYRQVFRCMPDSEVLDWKAYHAFNDYSERFMQSQGLGGSKPMPGYGAPSKSGPPGADGGVSAVSEAIKTAALPGSPRSKGVFGGFLRKTKTNATADDEKSGVEMQATRTQSRSRDTPDVPDSASSSAPTTARSADVPCVDEKDEGRFANGATSDVAPFKESTSQDDTSRQNMLQFSEKTNSAPETTATQSAGGPDLQQSTSANRRKRANTKTSGRQVVEEVMDRESAEELLNQIQGHLVQWPYNWLEKEEAGGKWLYNIDTLAPLEIYD